MLHHATTTAFFSIKFPHKSYSYHTESPQCDDPLSRRVFKKGEMWRLSECAHCVCGESNTSSCSVVRCPTPRCNDPFKIKGICCPACPQDYQEGCYTFSCKTVIRDRSVKNVFPFTSRVLSHNKVLFCD